MEHCKHHIISDEETTELKKNLLEMSQAVIESRNKDWNFSLRLLNTRINGNRTKIDRILAILKVEKLCSNETSFYTQENLKTAVKDKFPKKENLMIKKALKIVDTALQQRAKEIMYRCKNSNNDDLLHIIQNRPEYRSKAIDEYILKRTVNDIENEFEIYYQIHTLNHLLKTTKHQSIIDEVISMLIKNKFPCKMGAYLNSMAIYMPVLKKRAMNNYSSKRFNDIVYSIASNPLLSDDQFESLSKIKWTQYALSKAANLNSKRQELINKALEPRFNFSIFSR